MITQRSAVGLLGQLAATLLLLGLLTSGALANAPRVDVAGTWSGTLLPGQQDLQLIYRLEKDTANGGVLTGTLTVPAQNATLPLDEVTFEGQRLEMSFPLPGGGSFEGTLSGDGETLEGTFHQGGAALPLTLKRGEPERPKRPQEPSGELPYSSTEFVLEGPERLVGSLTRPKKGANETAIVLVAGAGAQDRDGTLFDHRPLLVLADQLTRAGYTVLRLDEPGVGQSAAGPHETTPQRQGAYLVAAARQLLGDSSGSIASVGIFAHSEGGLSALHAARADAISFLVLLAAPATPGVEQLKVAAEAAAQSAPTAPGVQARIVHAMARALVADQPGTDDLQAAGRSVLESYPADVRSQLETIFTDQVLGQISTQIASPWSLMALKLDPAEMVASRRVPILALYAENDQVLNNALHQNAMRRALDGIESSSVIELEGVNHFFQPSDGSLAPAAIEQTMTPEVWTTAVEWLRSLP